jgi:hypothetical protein
VGFAPRSSPGVGNVVLVLLVGRRGHVGDEEVDEPVVVHVAEVRAHRENEVCGSTRSMTSVKVPSRLLW